MKKLSIASWNVSWQGMSDKKTAKKIADAAKLIIDTYKIDIFCVQEATNWQLLQSTYKGFDCVITKSGKEEMATFWRKSSDSGAGDGLVCGAAVGGEFESGRPYLFTDFGDFCVTNVHLGHYNEKSCIKKISEAMDKISKSKTKRHAKKNAYHSLIIGDTNAEFAGKQSIDAAGEKYYFFPCFFPTCCGNPPSVMFDHILSNSQQAKKECFRVDVPWENNLPGSDHYPIVGIYSATFSNIS